MKRALTIVVLLVALPLGAAADCKDHEPLPRPGPMDRSTVSPSPSRT